MQFNLSINQVKAVAWGLNAQQALLFAWLYEVPSWADSRQIDGHVFFNVAKTKIVAELPLLTDKPDTAYRLMKQLAKAGLIAMASCDNKTYMRLLPKARSWNRDVAAKGSEKNPTLGEEQGGSEKFPTSENYPSGVGKISEPGSEKSPTNQGTNDQVTKDQNPSLSDAGEREPNVFERAAQQTDDGQPVANTQRQQPMTLDWEPDFEVWQRACWERGMAPDADVSEALIDFREHFAAQPGRTLTHADWTRRFTRWVYENLKRQQAQAQVATTGGASHANRRERTPARRLTAAEARERDRIARAGGGQPGDVFPGEYTARAR